MLNPHPGDISGRFPPCVDEKPIVAGSGPRRIFEPRGLCYTLFTFFVGGRPACTRAIRRFRSGNWFWKVVISRAASLVSFGLGGPLTYSKDFRQCTSPEWTLGGLPNG